MPETTQQTIRRLALEAGFDFCGFTGTDLLKDDFGRLKSWIADGFHGSMGWMERNPDVRTNPGLLVPEAKSVIVLLTGYYTSSGYREGSLQVARYARYKADYHDVIRKRLHHLSEKINALWPDGVVKSYTDTGPVAERALAARAGLGWIGRNSCLIVPGGGSYYFISVIFSRLELEADLPVMADHCPPSCNKCLVECPTGALVAPGRLDARKCIAYHTIENKGEIDPVVSGKMNDRVFGCDICQEVCPWNRRPKGARLPIGEVNNVLEHLERAGWQSLTHNEFLEYFRKTPVHRTGYHRMMRNVTVCLNSELGDVD